MDQPEEHKGIAAALARRQFFCSREKSLQATQTNYFILRVFAPQPNLKDAAPSGSAALEATGRTAWFIVTSSKMAGSTACTC